MEKIDEIIIRIAHPQDVEALTELHLRSFKPEDHIAVVLGREYVKAVFNWIVTDDSTYALIAEDQKAIIGYISVCDHPYFSSMFLACFSDFLKCIRKKPSLLINRLLWKRFFRFVGDKNTKAKKILKVSNIAQVMFGTVDAQFRGKGIYLQLDSAIKKVSQARGSRALIGDVYKGNSSIRRVKDKDNWVEIPELETTDTVAYIAFLDDSIANELNLS